MDPLLDWMGTQTLFPFDRDRLFVLTHLEWARNPGPSRARRVRTNARYYDNPVVRFDKCIRDRFLSDAQVKEINFITKSRAHRYIAGTSEDDLYPERHLKTRLWSNLGRFLVPTKKLYEFGGEMMMKMKDGGFYFQDEFGRRPSSPAEHEAKVREAERMHRQVEEILARHKSDKSDDDTR
jgi:hypothetical protein